MIARRLQLVAQRSTKTEGGQSELLVFHDNSNDRTYSYIGTSVKADRFYYLAYKIQGRSASNESFICEPTR